MGRPRELPLLEIRKRVLFPGVLLRLQIGRPKSVRLVESIWDPQNRTFKKGAMIAVTTVRLDSDSIKTKGNQDPEDELEVVNIQEKDGDMTVYQAGTVARVLQLSRVNGSDSQSFQFSLLVEGISRMKLSKIVSADPFHVAQVMWLPDEGSVNDTKVRALAMNVREIARDLLELQRKRNSPLGKKTKEVIENLDRASPGRLADLLAANMDASVAEKQGVLAELELSTRLRHTLELLNRQVEVFKISDKIQNEVEGKLKNTQREYYLRQQLRAINEELNSINGKSGANSEQDEMEILEESLAKATLPEEARQAADREFQRLKQMQPSQPEYSVIRTYLELMVELPWGKTTKDNLDIQNARDQLEADHHALDKVKKRIIEFLAVRSLKNDMKGPILCLVGPPGVGKTSLGKSVAEALGRKFRRLALGGVRDEAEIRGHRRTYIGALPGNIITTLKKAGSENPVILLDEIDKLGRDIRGDPGSALLEVLDPEQNDKFVDHYLNVPFDLSKVLFVATANRLDTIPGPLLDRMELIELPGYTITEKHEIAVRHLVPKQMKRHGIDEKHVEFSPGAIDKIISSYTREAGVRSLDREIAAVCRYVAVRVAESRDRVLQTQNPSVNEITVEEHVEGPIPPLNPATAEPEKKLQQDEGNEQEEEDEELPLELEPDFKPMFVTEELAEEVLGPVKYESEIAQRTAVPGVATGLAWTSVGGEILFIESWLHRGNGRVQLTGQLGSVMEESVKAALSFVRGNLHELGLDRFDGKGVDLQKAISKADLHVHFPAGAVPKDGPSAGVAVTASILSALSGRRVRADTACTGEITLRGLVLPVGGIKEKVIAAHRAGLRRVVLPKRNEKDIVEIPEEVRKDLKIILASDIVSAMEHLFEQDEKVKMPRWLKELEVDSRTKSRKQNPRDVEDQIHPSSPSEQGSGETTGWSARNPMRGRDLSGPILESKM